jgi:P27 family predicted phage terminase small subunit
MPRPEYEGLPYLTKRGRKIFSQIVKHVKEHDLIFDIDVLELSMLANSIDAYERAAEYCNTNGFSKEIEAKQGSFGQIIPEYTVMRNEYNNILKHAPKYGLNPGDREKIFGGLKKKKKKDPNEGLD